MIKLLIVEMGLMKRIVKLLRLKIHMMEILLHLLMMQLIRCRYIFNFIAVFKSTVQCCTSPCYAFFNHQQFGTY